MTSYSRTRTVTRTLCTGLSLAALWFGCSTSKGASTAQPDSKTLFSSAIKKVTFEIDYVPGAEPYLDTDAISIGGSRVEPFTVLRSNLEKLFSGTTKVVDIPTTLDKMESLPSVTGTDFTTAQIQEVAAAHRGTFSSGETAAYYIVWLNGYYARAAADGGAPVRDEGVLAVSLGATGIIAMFKPVIASSVAANTAKRAAARMVEQMVLLHEFGHAVGYVNNGVPMVTPHQDTEHGRHCNEPTCIMYWTNESFDNLLEFVQRVVKNESAVVFDAACLADANGVK